MKPKIQQLLTALKKGDRITGSDAWMRFGYYRLSDGIFKLRGKGYDIKTEMVQVDKMIFARYYMQGNSLFKAI